MALELLAGPFNVEVASTIVAAIGGFGQIAYVQGLGLISLAVNPGSGYGTYAIQLDGTAHQRSSAVGTGRTLLVDLRTTRGLVSTDGLSYSIFDFLACSPADPFLTCSLATHEAQAVCADRFLCFDTTGVLKSLISDGHSFASEYAWSGSAPGGLSNASRGHTDTEVCVAFSTTKEVRWYDTRAKTESRPRQFVGDAFDALWYVPKWDVFIGLKTKSLRIYANAVRPASISAPAALDSIAAGYAARVRVQVLGAQSEPCVGELVDWSVTAGGGSLAEAQSTTDANGYALNSYVAPLGTVGSVSIQAAIAF